MGTWRRNFSYGAPLLCAAVLIFSCRGAVQSSELSNTTEASGMEQESHLHHGIDYIEFVVTDMGAAQRFYTAAFDWKFTDYGPDYAGIQGRGREVGGLRLDTRKSVGGPLVILYSRDLDASVAKVRDAGGKIVQEPFAFPGGRRFHFQDPSGNELAVWSEE